MRSRAAELLANGESEEEVSAAITPADADLYAIALLGAQVEAIPATANPQFEDALTAELGKYLRLTGGSWRAEAQADWLIGATEELAEYPLSILLPELAKARRREPYPNKLISAIVERVEPKHEKLKAEIDRLTHLSALVKLKPGEQG